MVNILLGLLGLSLVIVVHELGHFFAARAAGVEVETFSIGWGPRLFSFGKRGTEWRVSALPIGGYCRMKGENEFSKALEQKLPHIPAEKGSFYGVSPWKRIGILASGPLANVVLAIIISSIVSLAGITIRTAPSKIVLASEYTTGAAAVSQKNPADLAGLQTGDVIASIDGAAVRDYSDLQEMIGLNPGKTLNFVILRNGQTVQIDIAPRLDKNSGQGLIGIYAWIDPLVESVEPGSAAAIAGLESGDRIIAVGGMPVRNTIDIMKALDAKPETVGMTVRRGEREFEAALVLSYPDPARSNLGLVFSGISRTDKATSPWDALGRGTAETYRTAAMAIKGIGLLFKGVNLTKAISGPARITYLVGNSASENIKASGLAGIPPILSFLAYLSVSLFIMNLLPLPALDGGQIVLCLVEIARNKPLRTKTIYRYQFVGTAMIMVLFLFATFSDVLFFTGK